MKSDKTKTVRVPTILDEEIRKPPKKLNVNDLKPAIVDGKPSFNVGDELVMRRDHLKDPKLYMCRVTKIDVDGDVFIRNLTLQQDFVFQLKNPPSLWLYTVGQ